ncbi:Uncharacterized protein FKW44_012956 [Caligus rogercresseyi]|uniref:Uncharacterized protein n=1 Tax=Caligus rogercresseyi TaxID=217165 RepID=A0A7T8K9X4_CALRO|nr:Uncharacterized protein FKW44_012956 [Caligus rogercresseyi]
MFNLDRTHNRQNTTWICQDPEDVPMVFKSKKPASVIVLGVISSDGDVMAPTSSPGPQDQPRNLLEVMRNVVVP